MPRLVLMRVYPRACGGTKMVPRVLPEGQGLSPRVRGNLYLPSIYVGFTGSIPARAGEPQLEKPA